MNKKIIKYFKNPFLLIKRQKMRKLRSNSSKYSDEIFLKKAFKILCGYKLNLDNPLTYNEKIQWLKLNDHKPIYHTLADKFLVRQYVKDKIGEHHLIPLIATWDNPEDVDFSTLPNSFVIKCNHNSGRGMILCKDKNELDIKKTYQEIKDGFEEDYFLLGREWAYKDIRKKIICEEYIKEPNGDEINDYKFFCCNGKFKFLLVCSNRHSNLSNDWYDEKLNHLPCINGPKNNKNGIRLPNNISEMIKIAETLSQGLVHVRVDLYSVDNSILFGEMTFYESSGFASFKPKKFDYLFGSFINLPKKKDEK
jgi:hypothetical protein